MIFDIVAYIASIFDTERIVDRARSMKVGTKKLTFSGAT